MTLPEHGGSVQVRTVELAHEWARRAVLEITRKTSRRAVPPSTPGGQPHLGVAASDKDAVARIRVAAELRLAARQLAIGYARCARGVGFSWDEIGAALGAECLTDSAAAAADAAFGFVADTAAFEWPAFVWVCRACRRTVIDRGPCHPADREDGHTDTCRRMAAMASQKARPT